MKRYEIVFELTLEFLLLIFQFLLCVWIIPKTLGYFWPFVTGGIIAVLTWPIISYVNEKLRINRRFVSIFVLVFFIAAVAFGVYYLLASLGQEAVAFMTDLPHIIEQITDVTKEFPNRIMESRFLPESLKQNIDTIVVSGKEAIVSLANQIASVGMSYAGPIAKNITNFFIGFIVSIMSAYFFVLYREKMSTGYDNFLPKNVKERLDDIISHIKGAIGGYFIAQLKIMGIIFLILLAGLFFSGNPYSLILAFLISLLDVIPFFGTGFVLLPWAVYDFLVGNYSLVVLRVILYVICLLGRQLLQPRIIGDSVGLDPFFTLLLIYVGFKAAGIRGFLIAMIVGIILLNFYKMGLFDKKIIRIKNLFVKLKESNEQI